MSSHSKDFNSDYPCTHTNTLLVIDRIPGEAGYRLLCWHPVCRSAGTVMKCKVLLLNYSRGNRLSWLFSESIGRLYRFPPVSRRKGSMTSQSDTQWVTVCMPVPDLPPPLSLPPPLRQTSQLSHVLLNVESLSASALSHHAVMWKL